jgi:hypothetical protein
MRHLSGDPNDARRWAEARHARPSVTDEGELELALPDREFSAGEPVSWEEFAGIFTAEQLFFVWDDVPGSDFFAIGPEQRVRHFAEEALPEQPPA